MKYTESDLLLHFDDALRVRKFDDSRYFQILSGLGLKGVDFIAIDSNNRLYLIEVKNFKKRAKSPVPPDTYDLIGDFPPLQDHFVRKIQDSCQLIEVIYKYLHRKWWLKIAISLGQHFPFKLAQNKDWRFWLDAYDVLKSNPSKVECILLLELENEYPEISSAELDQLPNKMMTYFNEMLLSNFDTVSICDLDGFQNKFSRIR